MSRIFLIMFFLTTSVYLAAQEKPAEKKKQCGCSFTSINQVGLIMGEETEAFQFQTINGLRFNTWMVGAGLGIDGYRYRSIPLFLHGVKDFKLKSSVFYLYSDIGLNFPWLETEQKTFSRDSEYDHGIYFDGGLGYKIPIGKQFVVFSGGYSIKEHREFRSIVLCPFAPPCVDQVDVYSFSLRRWSLKLGIQL